MPRAPKLCGVGGCRNLRPCELHPPAAAYRGGLTARQGRGTSRAERALVAQVLAEEPYCRDCMAPSTQAGHIVGRAQGGRFVRSNLKGQCVRCNLKQREADKDDDPYS